VLEAEEPGVGASGRNTGFVVPSFKTHLGPSEVAQLLGSDVAQRLTNLVDQSGTTLFDLIERLGLRCSAERTGWIQPAHSLEAAAMVQTRARQAAERGRPVQFLSAAETEEVTGIPGYHGALVDRSGGQVNPLALARGLAAAAAERGAAVCGASPVTSLARSQGKWIAETATGSVSADRVVLTTNALVGKLKPDLFKSFIPVKVYQIATCPLPTEVDEVLPRRHCLSDTRRHTFAARWSPDGRLMTGGIVPLGPMQAERARHQFVARLQRRFPRLPPIRADFVWHGTIAQTSDSLPRLYELGPGLISLIGCNGRGVALTTALGKVAASLLAGAVTQSEFPLPIRTTEKVRARRLATFGPSLWLPWSTFRDWQDSRSSRRPRVR
jgi:glycine/D-amino acid oxidase-like deaminating enzyme